MVHLSKQALKKENERKLRKKLAALIAKTNKTNAENFLRGLLGDSEQIMIAKRLAAMMMFHEGHSANKVAGVLRMSKTTVMRMYEYYTAGKYNGVLRVVGKNKAEREQFWETFELVLRGGMPPMGKGRWKYIEPLFK